MTFYNLSCISRKCLDSLMFSHGLCSTHQQHTLSYRECSTLNSELSFAILIQVILQSCNSRLCLLPSLHLSPLLWVIFSWCLHVSFFFLSLLKLSSNLESPLLAFLSHSHSLDYLLDFDPSLMGVLLILCFVDTRIRNKD
jgi:hypothetical protein